MKKHYILAFMLVATVTMTGCEVNLNTPDSNLPDVKIQGNRHEIRVTSNDERIPEVKITGNSNAINVDVIRGNEDGNNNNGDEYVSDSENEMNDNQNDVFVPILNDVKRQIIHSEFLYQGRSGNEDDFDIEYLQIMDNKWAIGVIYDINYGLESLPRFYAVKTNGSWKVVAEGQDLPYCDVLRSNEFPNELVNDCYDPIFNDGVNVYENVDINFVEENVLGGLYLSVSEFLDESIENINVHSLIVFDNKWATGMFETPSYQFSTPQMYLVKIENKWVVASMGQDTPSCELTSANGGYNFPYTMIPDCVSL